MNFLKKILNVIVGIWKWLVYSSANAGKISLTIKSLLLSLIPVILMVTKMYNVSIDNAALASFIDQVSAIIIVIGGAITAISACFGALRKIYTTVTGSNDVINTLRG